LPSYFITSRHQEIAIRKGGEQGAGKAQLPISLRRWRWEEAKLSFELRLAEKAEGFRQPSWL